MTARDDMETADGGLRPDIEVVAAFADGEAVDPVQLDRALADAAGRAYLVDLLALRGLVDGHGLARPAAAHSESAAGVMRGEVRREFRRDVASPVRWWPAAAAIAVVSVLGGYVAGQRTTFDGPGAGGTAATEPAETGQPTPPAALAPASPIDAPEPTSVIQLRPGVDWQEQGSGS
jgi:hypothetical protein